MGEKVGNFEGRVQRFESKDLQRLVLQVVIFGSNSGCGRSGSHLGAGLPLVLEFNHLSVDDTDEDLPGRGRSCGGSLFVDTTRGVILRPGIALNSEVLFSPT